MAGKGRFIVLEGCDGTSKSTQAKLLAQALMRHGLDVLHTFEPTNTPMGRRALDMARLGQNSAAMNLMVTDRMMHLSHVIEPALKVGTWVVCERFQMSTAIYNSSQDLMGNMRWQRRQMRNPDRVLILRTSIGTIKERLIAKGDDPRAGGDFDGQDKLNKRRGLYDSLGQMLMVEYPGVYEWVDASGTEVETLDLIMSHVADLFPTTQ